VLGGGGGLLLSSLEGSNLVKISQSLLPGGWSALWRLWCSFYWEEFPLSLLKDIIGPVLPELQGGCRKKGLEHRQLQNGDGDAKLLYCI
jgi:hypothetical protein